MSLTKMKANQLQARKHGDSVTASLLTTLIGEIQTELRKPNAASEDEILTATVKSFLKKNKEFSELSKDQDTVHTLAVERDILESYLPSQLTEDQLREILSGQFPQPLDVKSKGLMMKYLKDNYANQYDGKLASEVVNALIQGK